MTIAGIPKLIRWHIDGPEAWLALCLIIATIPVVVFGLILKLTGLDDAMRSVAVIGWTRLVFGWLIYWADKRGAEDRTAAEWRLKDAFVMGLWQAVALIPGTSRSGITITAGRIQGYARPEATRLAMLMSIPTILASGVLLGAEVAVTTNVAAARDGVIAALFAFVAALLALDLMMRFVRRFSFTPFVVYRTALGVILLWIAYT